MNSFSSISACELNRDGLRALASGDYSSAIRCFVRGLTLVKQVIASGEGGTKVLEDTSAITNRSETEKMSMPSFQKQPNERELLSGASTAPLIFRSALCIEPENGASYSHFVALSLTFLYNLALSHHSLGLEHSVHEVARSQLKKAASLYEFAYSIHMSGDIELTGLQTLAIVNNLGHVHAALGNMEQFQECMQHQINLIMYIHTTSEREEIEELPFFLANAFVLTHENKYAPAA